MLCIPYYLIKEKVGVISLKEDKNIDFDVLCNKLAKNDINVILNSRTKSKDSTVVIHEAHIGHATEPGQVYLLQTGSDHIIYTTMWGSSKFQEIVKISLIIEKLNEDVETIPFNSFSELRKNLFCIANVSLSYYLGFATMVFGFQFMKFFHDNRHPAMCAFWIPSKK